MGVTPPRVAVVNETLARRLFPKGDAIGAHVRMGPAAPDTPWITIVGVIGDVHHTTLEQAPKPEFYISGRQGPPSSPMLAVRTTGVYCIASCAGRPLRKNVEFHDTRESARAAGFRACLRCKPDREAA